MSGLLTKPLNPQFVDVLVGPDGQPLRGCRPRTEAMGKAFPVYEDAFASTMRDYPRSDWDDVLEDNQSLETLVPWTHDQSSEGTCASNATALAFEIAMAMILGTAHAIKTSPIAVYRWIASGPGTGSVISDNLKQIQKVGTLPVDTPANRAILKAMGLNESHVLTHTGYYQKFPANWQETAAHFVAVEAYETRSFAGAVTGMFNGFALVYGRAGHAICGVVLVKSGKVYYIKYANSWGKWGEVGENGLQMFGFDSESYVTNSFPSYGAYLIRTVRLSDAMLQAIVMSQALAA